MQKHQLILKQTPLEPSDNFHTRDSYNMEQKKQAVKQANSCDQSLHLSPWDLPLSQGYHTDKVHWQKYTMRAEPYLSS